MNLVGRVAAAGRPEASMRAVRESVILDNLRRPASHDLKALREVLMRSVRMLKQFASAGAGLEQRSLLDPALTRAYLASFR